MLAGLVAIVRWGGIAFQPPVSDRTDQSGPLPVSLVIRHYCWYVAVGVISGLGAGLLAAGPGGRLIMRLLAVTAGAAAQGKKTEADQVVGRISLDGTLSLVVFSGLIAGILTAVLYIALRRWLPSGRLGGVALGVGLLVVLSTRLEPLRPDNVDFGLVGPGVVSVAAYGALALFHGMLTAALAGRLSRAIPLISTSRRKIAAYIPALPALLPPLVILVFAAGLLTVIASRAPRALAAFKTPRAVLAGRVVLLLGGLVAFPGFVSDIASIVARS